VIKAFESLLITARSLQIRKGAKQQHFAKYKILLFFTRRQLNKNKVPLAKPCHYFSLKIFTYNMRGMFYKRTKAL